jgi:hypothetical protein
MANNERNTCSRLPHHRPDHRQLPPPPHCRCHLLPLQLTLEGWARCWRPGPQRLCPWWRGRVWRRSGDDHRWLLTMLLPHNTEPPHRHPKVRPPTTTALRCRCFRLANLPRGYPR